jgi:hypothetical protein
MDNKLPASDIRQAMLAFLQRFGARCRMKSEVGAADLGATNFTGNQLRWALLLMVGNKVCRPNMRAEGAEHEPLVALCFVALNQLRFHLGLTPLA